MDRLPRVFIWAWERPENLRDLDHGVGVAFLAQTIAIAGREVHVTPRHQPLRVAAGTALVAVTRIEVSAAAIEPATRASIEHLVSAIAGTAALPRIAAVQLDFDATASERPFYRELIFRLRDRLPATVPISITALASWCAGDDWLGGLPIDEAVPMLFRMGPANQPFLRLAVARATLVPACRGAIGTSLDEPIDARADGRRIYIFNPRPWTEATLFQARRRAIE
jgi:Protein of unknown function (DUF3142)